MLYNTVMPLIEELPVQPDTIQGEPEETKTEDDGPKLLTPEEVRIICGGPEECGGDASKRQLQIVAEWYLEDYPDMTKRDLTADDMEIALSQWAIADHNVWSKSFRKLLEEPAFSNHPRLKGDVANITLNDVKYVARTGFLPQE